MAADAPADLGAGLHLIDTRHDGMPRTIGVYLQDVGDGRFALIEAGPGSTLPAVEAGVRAAGFEPSGLAALIVTHVHLDHAGAAGQLAAWSDAPVYVHEAGAKHLADPTKLWNSAARIYGDDMTRLWGEMRPVPAERLRTPADGERIRAGGRAWRVLHTPGHARHHLSLLDDDVRLFTGDAAAILLPGVRRIRPALPPPEVDLEAYDASLRAQREARPESLLLTHFGVVEDADAHLARVGERNHAWADEVRAGLRAGEDLDALTARMERLEDAELREAAEDADAIRRDKAASSARMTAMGLQRYWTRLRPDAL